MTNLANRPPLGQKPEREPRDPARMAAVAALPCIICEQYGFSTGHHVEVHHCIHERHSQRRTPDSMTIPLCVAHHRGVPGFVSVHGSPAAFKTLYGRDTDYLPIVNERLANGGTND